jgi:outer membrane protein assembly factor BamA
MQKLRFLLIIPMATLAWVGAAALGPAPAVAAGSQLATTPSAVAQGLIGRITWQGNTVLSTAQLNAALGLKPGDAYDSIALKNKLQYSPDGQDITSRYMDQGYLFFSINPVAKTQPDGSTDLTFTISEGRRAQIGTITVTGNHKVSTAAILEMLPLHTGDFFNRTKLLQSQKILAENGAFDPTAIGINPQPAPRPTAATDLVNITFVVKEK